MYTSSLKQKYVFSGSFFYNNSSIPQITKRWMKEYSDRAGEEPFVLGYHASIADLKKEDKVSHVRDVSNINARGPGVGHKLKAPKKIGGKKR